MSSGSVHFERKAAAAYITFDRPETRNAMTWSMYDQLLSAVETVATEPDVRIVVLRGAGRHFVAGTDIAQFAAFTGGDDGVAYERRIESIVAQLETLPTPTLAVVEGHAAGAGLVIAAACDLRICTPDARFSVPIARTVGNTLTLANHARLVGHLGPARTRTLLMTAASLGAEEARAAGFVLDVVDSAGLDTRVDELVRHVAGLAPLTLRATKALVARALDAMRAGGDDSVLRQVYGSADFREGVAAFTEKRPPRWEGR
jgi:enoyl-CoA hydratase/carnithine racemase